MRRISTPILLILACLLLPLDAAAQSPTKSIVIGLIPEMNVFKQMERFKPLADYLGEKTGVKVEFSILSRYGNIITRFSEENLDGAFFGSFTGAMAIRKLGVTPLARPVNLNGESTYRGYIYVRKDSGIRSVADMRGKKFAFVEKATTAGYVFPLAYLKKHGAGDIETFFGESFFAGSHDASLYAVLSGSADIGASKNTVFDWVRKTDPRVDSEILILAESTDVPSNGLCVRPDLDPSLKSRLKAALLTLDQTSQGQAVLEKFKALKFIETTAADYQPVIDLSGEAGIDLQNYQYYNE
ncbi:phosphonate ABC transporter substrate-binding protein [Desulfuromonas versatilis]|uniref:Phosphonate ABC transporter substrate-binding protein n=1 Tax=Desulfuromonas versatilis TaxID=2802975 RepID=A0ABN6DUS3_9BACT|nr:phosphate/phosphite/phosphonate ABC transporter substrate-binding protein [Desulfuromonas versatilis]BCR03853.1 phosphonate ABC transporter substrate-binding protein [Desulfuromonas versatilis]